MRAQALEQRARGVARAAAEVERVARAGLWRVLADDAESIERRLETARQELAQKDRYDHSVVNADLDRTVEEILARIRAVPERT